MSYVIRKWQKRDAGRLRLHFGLSGNMDLVFRWVGSLEWSLQSRKAMNDGGNFGEHLGEHRGIINETSQLGITGVREVEWSFESEGKVQNEDENAHDGSKTISSLESRVDLQVSLRSDNIVSSSLFIRPESGICNTHMGMYRTKFPVSTRTRAI